MTKKVILSKTFSNEAEYNHFKSQYDANTTAWENRWNLEVEGEASAPAETAQGGGEETTPPAEAPPAPPAETPAPAENTPPAETPASDAPAEGAPQETAKAA